MSGYIPVVIIGAPRSGTNMLRDMLTKIPGWTTWPCDEINYIWRHGNVRYQSDAFPPELARPRVARYINRSFDCLARRTGAQVIVEKTCANSLRVGFVNKVIPNAHFIFIYRDGYDAVGSARHRWQAEFDLPYVLRKARFVPLSDMPYYAVRYLWNHLYRILSGRRRLAFWGPRPDDKDSLVETCSIEELCAYQWRACVESALDAFDRMAKMPVIKVSYETLVNEPETQLARIVGALGMSVDQISLVHAAQGVSAASVGKGRYELGPEIIQILEPILGSTQRRCGYE